MSDKRMHKLKSLLIQEIAGIINTEIKDPRLQGLVSVTDMKIEPDLRTAIVNVSVFDLGSLETKREKDIDALNSASHYIMFLLSRRLHLKYIPELEFRIDRSMEVSANISRIIAEDKKRRGE